MLAEREPTAQGIDYGRLPQHIRAGFQAYFENHLKPGGFVMACLGNNLTEAFGYADEINRERMFDIATFLYNEIPSDSWGSPGKVDAWLRKK